MDNNDAPFTGLTSMGDRSSLSTAGRPGIIGRDRVEIQRLDAQDRKIVWDAEHGLVSEEHATHGTTNESIIKGEKHFVPLGIRLEDGTLAPVPDKTTSMDVDELEYRGQSEVIPGRVSELVGSLFSL